MDLAARRTRDGVALGLHRQRSTEVVDLTTCLVLHPALVALMPPLRALLTRLQALRREGSVIANLLDSGPDVLLRTDAPLQLADRIALTEFARAHALPRIAWAHGNDEPEPVAILRPPTTSLSGRQRSRRRPAPSSRLRHPARPPSSRRCSTHFPPRGASPNCSPAAARSPSHWRERARVAAWEGDAASASALRSAANHAGLAGRIEVTQRDLARQPLQAKELAGFAAVVLDPPFAGAAAQVAQIAAATRASRHLCELQSRHAVTRRTDCCRQAGYRLTAATPIDQFLWSPRLESVVRRSIAKRGSSRRSRSGPFRSDW